MSLYNTKSPASRVIPGTLFYVLIPLKIIAGPYVLLNDVYKQLLTGVVSR